jgi:protein SCO1/2
MNLKHVVIITFVVLLILGWGLFIYERLEVRNFKGNLVENKYDYHGIRIYKEAPGFELTDQNNNRVSLSDFKGKLVLISWGFTHCPDICPLILSRLSNVMKELGDLSDNVQVVFITVDPERDTPSRLKSYIPSFDNRFIGLTGSTEDIEKVVKSYNAFFIKHPEVYGRGEFDTWDSYQMTHTTKVYLVDQNGRLLFYYPYDKLNSHNIAEDIKTILKG